MKIQKIRAHFDFSRLKYSFLLAEEDSESGRVWIGTNVEMNELDSRLFAEPTFELNEREAQELLDMLWRAGLRPTDVSSGSDVIEAMKNHIEDLRASHRAVTIAATRRASA